MVVRNRVRDKRVQECLRHKSTTSDACREVEVRVNGAGTNTCCDGLGSRELVGIVRTGRRAIQTFLDALALRQPFEINFIGNAGDIEAARICKSVSNRHLACQLPPTSKATMVHGLEMRTDVCLIPEGTDSQCRDKKNSSEIHCDSCEGLGSKIILRFQESGKRNYFLQSKEEEYCQKATILLLLVRFEFWVGVWSNFRATRSSLALHSGR